MKVAEYLPSGQFSLIAVSIALAGGLIVGAQYITTPHTTQVQIASAEQPTTGDDWQAQLDAIQAQAPGLPPAPSQSTVQKLFDEAKSSNMTDTVARSLLVGLSSASSQGLGADIPTQEQIIASAQQAAASPVTAKVYTAADLRLSDSVAASQHSFGNQVIAVLGKHTSATSDATLMAVNRATDTSDPKELKPLAHIQAEYEALASDLAAVPVPKTLSPLYLRAVNDVSALAASVDDMQQVFKDPLRGLKGLQQYQLMLGEVGRVFTSIAEALNKNGILFDKSEPGAAWNVFLSS